MEESLIYLDHAATTFPRQPEVMQRMLEQFLAMGCSPGRGGYDLAQEAEAFVAGVRQRLAEFFGAPDPDRVVFTANATDGLNQAVFGLTQPGGHVVSTRLEHNALLRPLHHLEQTGRIETTLVRFNDQGFVDPADIEAALRPDTVLVAVNHASNVLGSVQPVPEIGRICADRGIPLLVDAAQSAGYIPIDMRAWQVSALAFTGHKALLGPTGIGGLVSTPDVDIAPTRFGGTGVESHNPSQPRSFPQRLEAGTLNLLGVMGLNAGLDYLKSQGMQANHRRKMDLLIRLREALEGIKRVRLYGSSSLDRHVPVLSCNLRGLHPSDAGMILDGDHAIAVRTGLHCAPLVHADLGTAPAGTIRFSLGWNTTDQDVQRAIAAVEAMSAAA